MDHDIKAIIEILQSLRMPAAIEERDIHAAIMSVLDARSIAYEHECVLGPRCRIDFLVGDIGLEVKKGCPRSSVLCKQIGRYLKSERLSAILVVSQQYVNLPTMINGKKVVLITLNRLWGIALP